MNPNILFASVGRDHKISCLGLTGISEHHSADEVIKRYSEEKEIYLQPCSLSYSILPRSFSLSGNMAILQKVQQEYDDYFKDAVSKEATLGAIILLFHQ